ncbi:DNA polymerase thumb domain-containing protein [Sporosarcina pasteurii]|uniref:DNA polymerase IV n=1 Tax=Sporosarcina pasteurii TaxID=1474 RepID=A0A380BSC4_SPOPA|nr:UV damage repair protein UvrX [Sporosarcina pasteurii]MDS9471147.1 UV damage repair protein UvrX [Sporosarcina pasteurii]QBQ05213.1 UV damage repair protein UvrX [Sporosarcina pasteurii]SUJ05191.1 DNA polymerase IV [Sporosarcina pasteurii]
MNLPKRNIVCMDMRSFYASCAAVLEGLDVMETPIAIIGDKNRKGGVVLAASPPLKEKFGIQTGNRLFEIPDDPSIRLIEPKMQFFIDVSMEITRLLNQYVPKEAIHTYSIDESFIDLDGTERLWGPPKETVRRIQDDLVRQFELKAAFGIGQNLLLSKLALDLEAKKIGIAEWTYEDVPEKLWPVAPLSRMWGIGSRLERTLNHMGIFSVGDLANTSLEKLEKKFGVMGNQLYYHAHGIDLSDMGPLLLEEQVSFGKGQMLFRDYVKREDILVVILEMCEDVAMRARKAKKVGYTVHLSADYSKNAFGGGFSRSRSIAEATNDTMKIYQVCADLLEKFHDGRPIRRLAISLTKLEDEHVMQLSLFDEHKWRNRKLGETMDSLRSKYGSNAILRAVSYTEAGTAVERSKLIGGHFR